MPEITFPVSPLMSGILALVCLLLGSCTTVSETERDENHYAREAELLEAMDDFSIRSKRCKQTGRIMQIKRHSATRVSQYDANDYRLAECVRL